MKPPKLTLAQKIAKGLPKPEVTKYAEKKGQTQKPVEKSPD